MTPEKDTWHELPGPHAHARGKVLRPRLSPERRSNDQNLLWFLVAAALAATLAGAFLALSA